MTLQLSSCGPIGEGSCDFPGECEEPIVPHHNRVTLRTVTDVGTGDVLCSACEGCTMITPAIGQHLLIEDVEMSVEARNDVYDGIPEVPFGCNAKRDGLDPEVDASRAVIVEALHCLRPPAESDVGRISSMEVIALSRPIQRAEPLGDGSAMGSGYRYRLEVVGPGLLSLVPSGECEHVTRPRTLIDVMCGTDNPCADGLDCMASDCQTCVAEDWLECHFDLPSLCYGGCAARACDPELQCPVIFSGTTRAPSVGRQHGAKGPAPIAIRALPRFPEEHGYHGSSGSGPNRGSVPSCELADPIEGDDGTAHLRPVARMWHAKVPRHVRATTITHPAFQGCPIHAAGLRSFRARMVAEPTAQHADASRLASAPS